MGKQYEQLSLRERVAIDLLLREGRSQSEIARRLGRSRSTVCREVRRNSRPTKQWSGGYDGQRADALALRRRRWDARFKLARQPDLASEIRRRLAMGLSPEQVAGRLTLEHGRTIVSHESIYRFIYHRARCKDRSWYRLLPRAKHRRGRLAGRGGSLARLIKHRVPIDRRPAAINARREAGHWEGDLMVFGRKGRALLVLHERLSRFTILTRLQDKTAATVSAHMLAFFAALPEPMRGSLTVDNGGEFALHYRLVEQLGMSTYFCKPHAPWQKGGVENAIGRLRRMLPRKIDLADLPSHAIQAVEEAYNKTPRKRLGYKTPNELFSDFNAVALQS